PHIAGRGTGRAQGAPEQIRNRRQCGASPRAPRPAAGRRAAALPELGRAAAPEPGGAPPGGGLLPTAQRRGPAVKQLRQPMLMAALLFGGVGGASAQQTATPGPLTRAQELERRGNHAAAAAAYAEVLAASAGDASALLGLERSLDPIGRTGEVLPHARTAVGAMPHAVVYPVLIRSFMRIGEPDSALAAAEAWARLAPREPSPWRELSTAAMRQRNRPLARRAIESARERTGQ